VPGQSRERSVLHGDQVTLAFRRETETGAPLPCLHRGGPGILRRLSATHFARRQHEGPWRAVRPDLDSYVNLPENRSAGCTGPECVPIGNPHP
jgi:hypothetical protein